MVNGYVKRMPDVCNDMKGYYSDVLSSSNKYLYSAFLWSTFYDLLTKYWWNS